MVHFQETLKDRSFCNLLSQITIENRYLLILQNIRFLKILEQYLQRKITNNYCFNTDSHFNLFLIKDML